MCRNGPLTSDIFLTEIACLFRVAKPLVFLDGRKLLIKNSKLCMETFYTKQLLDRPENLFIFVGVGTPPHNTLQKNSVNMLQDIKCIIIYIFVHHLSYVLWDGVAALEAAALLLALLFFFFFSTLQWPYVIKAGSHMGAALASEDCCLQGLECLAGVTAYYLTHWSFRR